MTTGFGGLAHISERQLLNGRRFRLAVERGRAAWTAALLACLALVADPSAALAGGEKDGGKGPATLPPPGRVWVQLYAAKSLSEPVRASLEAAIVTGANDSGKTEYVHKESNQSFEEEIEAQLERGDEALEQAKKLIDDLDFEGAGESLAAAIDAYTPYLPELMTRDGNANRLIDALIQTVIIRFLNGDEDEASKALAQAFVLEPTMEFDRKRFPPQLEEFVIQELLLLDEFGKGTLEVRVKGGPATVFVNGIERGQAPVVVEGLPAGPNFVHLRVPGTKGVSLTARIEGKVKSLLEHELELPPSKVSGPLAKLRSSVGKSSMSAKMRKAADKLKVDGLLLVVPKVKSKSIELIAHLYDARSGKLVSRAATEVELVGGEAEASELGRSVVAGAVWVAGEKPRKESGPPFWKRKFWKSKYFWPAVGVTAGVVLVGAVAAVASGGLSPGQKVGLFPVVRF